MKANLKRWCRYYLLLQKRHLKSPRVYCLMALCLLFLYVFQNVVFPTSYRMEYGIYVNGAECADDVLAVLAQDPLYRYVLTDSREALMDEVRAGRLDCGFVFDQRMDTVTNLKSLNKLIDYITSTSTSKGGVIRELVFAAFVQSAMKQTLTAVADAGESYVPPDGAYAGEIQEIYDGYMKGDQTLQVIFETVDASETVHTEEEKEAAAAAEFSLSDVSLLDKFLALSVTLIFIAAIIFARVRFLTECRRMQNAMRGLDRAFWPFFNILAQLIPVAAAILAVYLAGLALYGVLTPAKAMLSIPVFALYTLVCAIWAFIYSGIFKKEAMYLGSILGVIVLGVVTVKPFFRVGMFVPAINILKWLFPMNYLL